MKHFRVTITTAIGYKPPACVSVLARADMNIVMRVLAWDIAEATSNALAALSPLKIGPASILKVELC